MDKHRLGERLHTLKRRALGVHAAAGVGWGILAALAVLIVASWADLAMDLPAGVRVYAWLLVAAIAVIPMVIALRRASASATVAALSRELDRVANTRGEVHAGVDLLLHPTGVVAAGSMTESLRARAIARAAGLATSIPSSFVVPARPFLQSLVALIGAAVAIGLMLLIGPRLVITEVLRFTDPYGDHPPYSPLTFSVDPGNAKVLFGGSLPIKVAVAGGHPQRLDLVVLSDDLHASDSLPMFSGGFSDTPDTWGATITNVTSTGWYAIRAGNARSDRFRLDVITVPRIENARVRITPPAYTHLPPYEGAIPPAGIAGLRGTKVELTLHSNRPLSGGTLAFAADSKLTPIALTPLTPGGQEATATFTLTAPGRLNARVQDIAGQLSTDALSANLVLTTDERPFVRILQPVAQSFATPNVELPVELSAEDDYGISKLQLFRGINDSQSLPQNLQVPATTPTHLSPALMLPLAAYGLVPGDTIKLFAHVEDTNPDGPGVSDSSVVVVTIISEADMQKLTLARQGMETLQSKYEQANRRLEAIDQQIQDLEKDLKDGSTPLTDAQRKKLDDLVAAMDKEESAIRDTASEDLPFDLDKALRSTLGKVADKMDQAKTEAKAIAGQPGLSTAGARDQLERIHKELQGEHEDFEAQATDPLQRFSEVFALQEDQAKFEQLYEQQRDLETRMQTLRDKNGEDNPDSKNRMRQMEDEQRGVRQDLQKLLDDIDTHTAQLPNDPSLDDLRNSAQAFSKAARESTIVEEMASSESGLATFSGLLGHAGAKRAADLMEELLSKCQGVSDQASTCLKFQPRLAQALGDTVQQMLDAEGLGSKPGNGAGGMGGYSMRRNSLQNIGLYGRLPNRAQISKLGGGQADHGAGADRWGRDKPGATDMVDAHGRQKASGGSDASVPSQYRRQVGDYFQRVADDLGDQQ